MSNFVCRRDFLKRAGTVGLGLSLGKYVTSVAYAAQERAAATAGGTGANNKLVAAVIGTNGRGLAHVDCLTGLPGAEIAYICDVDDRAIAKGIKATLQRQKAEPKGVKDFRKV